MTKPATPEARRRNGPRRQASRVLASFVAALAVTLLAPFVHAGAGEPICSARGAKTIVRSDSDGGTQSGGSVDDHAAHCPLCMPAGAPPASMAWDFTPPHAPAFVRRPMTTTRLARVAGAALPARGPPIAS